MRMRNFITSLDAHLSAQLMEMIRVSIKMPKSKLSDEQIRGVWNSIDLDGNGWIDAGEFGRFFRQGEKPMQEHRQQKADKAKKELEEANRPEYREPTLAEISIMNARRNKDRLEAEEAMLKQSLLRTSASLHNLPKSASMCLSTFPRNGSNQTLPPMR